MSLEGILAVNRFGLGARPGEVERVSADPKAWLTAQIAPAPQPVQADGEPFCQLAAQLVADLTAFRQQRRQARQQADPQQIQEFARQQRQVLIDEMSARFNLGFSTDRPFAERLVWFWTNHFTISTQNSGTGSLAGAYEREAIRPFIAGKFEDMLLAVATHPAMLVYLNNAQSVGPGSALGARSRRGLNENFGRELMELYSLGVDGGYTQADVIALAKLLTGWSLDEMAPPPTPWGSIVPWPLAGSWRRLSLSARRLPAPPAASAFIPTGMSQARSLLRGKSYPRRL